ncbi:class I SAM-dependent methyltransferase [Methylovorus sp. MP688]|uniref:class I SAM-dependent methyltransferase n=1 Tax=Methylovorus sp. (strain MP688) TaxID=887061 RepID=UPI0001EC4D96|nr:class I SAM-dependent methyltransferase [Methylovorus sp. MP688]ADQ85584.1 Tetratricopeptide TPR_2 repeat protein [Methylovorus sp. MP688]
MAFNQQAPVSLLQALRTAHQLHAAGDQKQAELICQQILAADARQPDAIHLLGVIALQDGNMEKATQHFQKAIKINSKNPQFHSNLGLAWHEQGKLKEAEQCYKAAIALDARYLDAWYNLHALLIRSGDYLPACEALSNVLALNPHDQEARLMLAILLEYAGKPNQSLRMEQMLDVTSPLMKARLDAWHYFRALSEKPLITGSNLATFKRAVAQANIKGLVMEFGVRHGNSIRQLVQLVGQEAHGFDSFQGLPEDWHAESRGSYSTKGVIPKVPPMVKLHAGWFDETLPLFVAKHEGPVRLINIDCDIYSSTKTVLDTLAERIVPGTVIVFDEYIGNEHWREDEYKAFQEAVVAYGWRYEYLAVSFFTKQVVVKITEVGQH